MRGAHVQRLTAGRVHAWGAGRGGVWRPTVPELPHAGRRLRGPRRLPSAGPGLGLGARGLGDGARLARRALPRGLRRRAQWERQLASSAGSLLGVPARHLRARARRVPAHDGGAGGGGGGAAVPRVRRGQGRVQRRLERGGARGPLAGQRQGRRGDALPLLSGSLPGRHRRGAVRARADRAGERELDCTDGR
eukprot:1166269-Rhodomonas_salina.5